jgi:hypothetical protein
MKFHGGIYAAGRDGASPGAGVDGSRRGCAMIGMTSKRVRSTEDARKRRVTGEISTVNDDSPMKRVSHKETNAKAGSLNVQVAGA